MAAEARAGRRGDADLVEIFKKLSAIDLNVELDQRHLRILDPEHMYGTINCNGINARGELAGVTTTSGADSVTRRATIDPSCGCSQFSLLVGTGPMFSRSMCTASSSFRSRSGLLVSAVHTSVGPIASIIRDRARRAPDAVAVSADGVALTYGALDAWADRIAAALREQGIGRGDVVALHLDRTPSTIAAEIAGLVCAAEIAKRNGDQESAGRWLKTADEWQANIEKWIAELERQANEEDQSE